MPPDAAEGTPSVLRSSVAVIAGSGERPAPSQTPRGYVRLSTECHCKMVQLKRGKGYRALEQSASAAAAAPSDGP